MINTRAGAIGVGMAILLALAGLVLTGLLLDYNVKLATGGDPILRPVCEKVGPRFGCEEALTSTWARFPFWKQTEHVIPTSLLGFVYFAAMSAWFLIVGRPGGSRYSWHWFAVLLTGMGAGFAAFLAWQSRGMSTICLVCAAVEAIAVLLFIVTLLIWPRRRQVVVTAEPVSGPIRGPMPVRVPAPDYPPGRALLAWLLMTAAVSALGWLGYTGLINRHAVSQTLADLRGSREQMDASARQAQDEAQVARAEAAAARASADKLKADAQGAQAKAETAEQQRTTLAAELEQARAKLAELTKSAAETAARLKDYEDDYQAVWFNFVNEPVVDIPVDPSDSIRGKLDAPHTIVMFMDLQCPYCQAASQVLQQKVAKYPDQLRLVVKHFPLDKDCNENLQGTAHPAACAAAVTVEAARAIGGEDAFWKMYEELFAHQAGFAKAPKEFVKQACERIGIDNDELWKKINTTGVWSRIAEQVKQAGPLALQATPAIYYDGRKVAGWANSKFWDFMMWQERHGGGTATARPPATRPAGAATRPE